MAFSPDLDEPVFTEIAAKAAPVVASAPNPVPAPEVTRTESIAVAVVAAPVVEPTPEPAIVVAEVAPEPERIIWFVTGSRVNVREGPSTDYSVLGKVIRGDAAEIISDPDAEWVKIRIEGDGVEGYIAKRFMAVQDPLG